MKSKLLLLLIAAATLYGCGPLREKTTSYTYVNATDKTIVVTLYDQNFYEDDEWLYSVNPDAKEVFSFVIPPREQYTRTLPRMTVTKKGFAYPFDDMPEAVCITVSNGEKMQSYLHPHGLFYPYGWYEELKNTNKMAHLQRVFDDEFMNGGRPVPVDD